MHKEWCGKTCCDCEHPCKLDKVIPCSPDCENLTENGYIKVKECLDAGCDNIKHIFNMADATDAEVLAKYGTITIFPY